MLTDKPKKQFIIVKGIVINSNKEFLVVRRNREWHLEAHDKWEFPGGKVDFGETPETAIIREVKEESGYDTLVTRLIPKLLSFKWVYDDRESQQILIAYVCELLGGEAILKDHGVSEIKWLKKEELLNLECLPGTKEFLEFL